MLLIMAIFEGLFGKRRQDSSENQEEPQQRREEPRLTALNKGPQEPVLPDREALKREAQELFVSKEKKPVMAAIRTESSSEQSDQKVPYTGDAEVKEPPPQDAAMTKARSDVLDILARIEKAGLPVSPELRTTIKNELANLASEAARIEFQEAERSDPTNVLQRIYDEVSAELGENIASTSVIDAAKKGLDRVKKDFIDRFNQKKSELAVQGIPKSDLTPEFIVNKLFGPNGIISFNVFEYNLRYDDVIIELLFSKCGFFPGNIPVSLIDLQNAIRKTGNQTSGNGNPYYIANGFTGLPSQRNELRGLEVASFPDGRDFTRIQLRGGKEFWLRVAKNMREL